MDALNVKNSYQCSIASFDQIPFIFSVYNFWVIGFMCRLLLTQPLTSSLQTIKTINKQTNSSNCSADGDRCPGLGFTHKRRTQMFDINWRFIQYTHIFIVDQQ